MLLTIKEETTLKWKGEHTQTVHNRPAFNARAVQEDFPIWVATGGNLDSTSGNCGT